MNFIDIVILASTLLVSLLSFKKIIKTTHNGSQKCSSCPYVHDCTHKNKK